MEEIPVSDCPNCGLIPVAVLDYKGNEPIMQGIVFVYCSGCDTCLNTNGQDIKVEWYELDQLEKIGYQVIKRGSENAEG